MIARILIAGCAALCLTAAPEQDALSRISANSLRGNLSFLASDALEGRATPSKGLNTAAEFIASRFRAAGLQPIFQTAKFAQVTPRLDDFRLTISTAEGDLDLGSKEVRVRSLNAMELDDAQITLLPPNGVVPPVEGKIVAGEARRYGGEVMLNLLQSRRPAMILLFSKNRARTSSSSFLLDTEAREAPVFRIANDDAFSSLTARDAMKVSVHLSAPERKDAMVSNVAAILQGSDAVLKDQYVMVTAHYDHLGMKDVADGDRIYNGANDDGSGTVSVLEIANAMAASLTRPKRSTLFVTFFGEEEGLLGSFYYAKHPLVPLKDTIADINLEQMGRTDDTDGEETSAFGFTGLGYSDLPTVMEAAAAKEGVRTYTRKGADDYFARSDNYALALAGVVAHTIVVAFDYPDYHSVADEWARIDFENMAKVDRAVAAGILQLANASSIPRWSNSPSAAPYREAGR